MAEQRRTVNAPIEHVWAQVTDPWVYTGWVVGASHIRGVDAEWPQQGSRLYHQVGAWPLTIKDSTQVLTSEPPRNLVLQARGWPLGEARVELHLSEEGPTTTQVVMDEIPTNGPGSWVNNPLSEALLKRRLTECLARLASIAEQRH